MPIYLGNTEIGKELVDSYELGSIYLGNNKIQSGIPSALPIPQSGLIFNVDANLTSSYPGSGSIWYNTATAGASTNLLFTGSVSYVTQNFGYTNYFQFNTASYWSTSNIEGTVNSRTQCAWVWVDNDGGGNYFWYGRGSEFTDVGAPYLLSTDTLASYRGAGGASNLSGSIETGKWYNVIGVGFVNPSVGANDSMSFYINGVLTQTASYSGLFISPRTNRAVFAETSTLRLAMLSIYNFSFSDTDAATYFNNTKEIFGY